MNSKVSTGLAYKTLLVEKYSALLPPKQRQYVEQRYFMDLSLAEIAERNKVSRYAVQDALKRSMRILVRADNALGLIDQQRKLEKLIAQIDDKVLRSKIAALL